MSAPTMEMISDSTPSPGSSHMRPKPTAAPSTKTPRMIQPRRGSLRLAIV